MDDARAVSAASGVSEEDALTARLYREHAAAIFAYLRVHMVSREEAEDLLLDVFLAASAIPS